MHPAIPGRHPLFLSQIEFSGFYSYTPCAHWQKPMSDIKKCIENMAAALFISFSRADMEETNWLARLQMYLTPFRRNGAIDVWDDGRIKAGARWKEEIAKALESAAAAVLLVGPGFLASDFVMETEVPVLLRAATSRGLKLFPIVVGFCGYNHTDLHSYQAFNSPDHPLESLSRSEQNRILNELAIAINKSLRADSPDLARPVSDPEYVYRNMRTIQMHLADTRAAFVAQCHRRDDLVSAIEARLKFRNNLEYEKFFLRVHSQLTDEERFEFDQIRAITEGPLQSANRKILETLETHAGLLEAIPQMTDLRQHLTFWLNKYDKVFTVNRAMCLLYTGVEDAVPFPEGIDNAVRRWLQKHKPGAS
jgi:hypothetical protein